MGTSLWEGRFTGLAPHYNKDRNLQTLQACRLVLEEALPILQRSTLYIFENQDCLVTMAVKYPSIFFYHLHRVKLYVYIPNSYVYLTLMPYMLYHRLYKASYIG